MATDACAASRRGWPGEAASPEIVAAGSRFLQPMLLRQDRALPADPTGGRRGMGPPGKGRGLVLVVDDSADLRQAILRLLRRAGYAAQEAEGAQAALDLLPGLPELRTLVSDVEMPGMSGFALAREASRLRPDLGVVLMSGAARAHDRHGLALPVLRKPFEPRDLIQAIEAAAPAGRRARPR